MDVVVEEPPEDPDDWTEEQWLEWLANAPIDPDTGRAHPLSRAIRTPSGSMLGAAMFGLDQAIFGERPKAEVVVVADDPGEGDDDIELDLEDPSSSRIQLSADD